MASDQQSTIENHHSAIINPQSPILTLHGLLLCLGVLWITLACGVLEKAPEATRQAQRTATQMAVSTGVAARNATVQATISVRSTARAQELSIRLTEMSAELKMIPSGSAEGSWLTRWLTDPACQPPCWENITPGVTPIDEAVKIVYPIPGVEITWLPTMDSGTEGEKSLQWEFAQSGYGWVRAEGGQEIVSTIKLGTSGEQILRLGEVIAAYGNPSTVVKGSCRSGATCVYSLVFKEKGMEVDIGIHEAQKVDVQADTEVSGIYFYPLDGSRLDEPGLAWSVYGQYDFSAR